MKRAIKVISVPVMLALVVLLFIGANCRGTGVDGGAGSVSASPVNRAPVTDADKEDYKKLWAEVDAHSQKSKPKSALETIKRIYKKAKQQQHHAQLIKALVHHVRYLQQVEENAFIKVHAMLDKELKESKFPVTPLLHSMLAEQYWNYYQRNRYRMLRRSAASAEFKQNDIRTWDARRLVDAVVSHYRQSLENTGQAKETPIDVFNDALQVQLKGRKYRPTLYDFLAHRAADIYINSEAGVTRPRYSFSLNDPGFLSPTKTFIDLKLHTKDTLSFKFFALKIFQDLARFHIDDADPTALVDAELKRLRFIYNNGVFSNKDMIYEKTLREMIALYDKHPVAAEIYFELAQLYDKRGNKYNAGVSDDYKWHKKKARQLCTEAIKKYPDSRGASACQNLIHQIEGKHIELTLEKVTVRKKPSRALLKYRNTKNVYFKIFKTNRTERKSFREHRTAKKLNDFLAKTPVKEWSVTLPDDGDFQARTAEIKIDGLDWGLYIVLASYEKNFDLNKAGLAHGVFNVSNISYIDRRQHKKGWEFYIVDRDTGHPLSHPKIQVWRSEYNRKERRYILKKEKLFNGSQQGYVNIPYGSVRQHNFFLEIIHKRDRLFSDQNYYLHQPYNPFRRDTKCIFFTDRAIYRPGQTVYFKGIMLNVDDRDGEKNKILPQFRSTVYLYDVNSQQVASLRLTSNQYGSISGSFVLPTGLLNGQMRIDNHYGRLYFSVEEYKRPKFDVKFKPLKKTFRLGDTVTVTGEAKAYAGFAIDNAHVKYRVVRRAFYPYMWYFRYRWYGFNPPTPSMEIANGTAKTRADGTFTVDFKAVPDLTIPKSYRPAFRYTVFADVTDLSGETRFTQKTIAIGDTALVLNASIPGSIHKEIKSTRFTINSTTLSGDFIKAKGTVTVHRLETPKRVFRSRLWARPDTFIIDKKDYYRDFPNDTFRDELALSTWKKTNQVHSGSFDTGEVKSLDLKGIRNWAPGKYVLEMNAADRFGNPVKDVKYFTLYSRNAKRLPFKMLNWFEVHNSYTEPGNSAEILIGSSEYGVKALYQIEYRGEIIKSQWLTINNRQIKIRLPILEKYRGNIGVHVAFVRRNRLISRTENIVVPWSNKMLGVNFQTFRNKLLPGQKEEWRIKIKGPKGDQAAAEMVATLYDASLDAFRSNYWGFNVFPSHYPRYQWNGNSFFSTAGTTLFGKFREWHAVTPKNYDQLNWYGFYIDGSRMNMRYKQQRLAFAADGVNEEKVEQEEDTASGELRDKARSEVAMGLAGKKGKREVNKPAPVTIPTSQDTQKKKPVKVRTNLNETAFFYPHLKTNEEGEIIVSFTVPEALTKWKMMGFAHNTKLQHGFVSNELVTQKDLMVLPNTPRFFREGDTLVYTAKITNLSDKKLSGTAKLKLFDAVTMQPVDVRFKNAHSAQEKTKAKNFTAAKGQSALVKWTLHIPDDLDAVTCRVVAQAGNFSDGEEKAVPILKNRMLVTESMPLPVRAKQTKSFTFKKLLNSSKSKTLKHHRLTLEFTSNPVWYAVQALPYLMEFPHECMEQVFSRFYANSIASYIVNSNPKIKRVFDIWQAAQDQKDSPNANALLSNLQKNQELKSLLIQETPWVLNGQSESERKRRIALLFDLNHMARNLDSALRKLKQGQLLSGGWSWFKGMRENRYITQHIVCGFAHLGVLKVTDPKKNHRIRDMVVKALHYMDTKIFEDYRRLLRNKVDLKKRHINYIQIHYLYARSYFKDIPLDKRDIEAFNYYKAQAKHFWSHFHRSKYLQGMLALIMKRYDQSETAVDIMESIKEHALYSEEMGMYWNTSYGYYWYQAPIETHALLIEAFDEVLNDAKSVDGLKTWLLKQKQTQDWKTTKATANACFALLLKGNQWLTESKEPEITLGKKNPVPVQPGKTGGQGEQIRAEAGTGYFKTSWTGQSITPDMAHVTVKNNNNIAAWGSLYWQYFEDLDKITPHKTPLSLKKKLFIETPSDTGPVLVPIDAKKKVKIGDRIKVRIELRVDRSMEYVHMKDMRASAFEPEDVISRYKWQDGLGYYQGTKDASTNFFIDYLPKGTYVFEYALRATHDGDFSNGITTIQCMYAPEFTSHSEGIRVQIGN